MGRTVTPTPRGCLSAGKLLDALDKAQHLRTVGGDCRNRPEAGQLTHQADSTWAGLTAGDLARLIEVALRYAPSDLFAEEVSWERS